MILKVTQTLYDEIEYYNLPSSGNGFSKESYSYDEEKQRGYEMFCNSWEKAKRSGNYRLIEISNDVAEIDVAAHCIDNVRHFAGSAASEPRPALEKHCKNLLQQIYNETKVRVVL